MSVKVAVRVRPFNQRELFLNSRCCVQMADGKTKLLSQYSQEDLSKREFTFDYSFWSHDSFRTLENGLMVPETDKFWSQQRVFNEVGLEIINNSWEGYNCCLFAYGQTGSGKSYSMIGFGVNKGIVPLACEEIFNRIARNQQKNKMFEVTVSMIEIYNEKVQDLLLPDSRQRPSGGLQIRESKKLGVYVDGVTRHTVRSFREIEKWMEQGSKNRSLASTLMNEYSSRAHTIISIEFVQREELTKNQVTQKSSTIHLIDLAGSERVAKTGLVNSDRLKEAGNINKSLHHLGLVIEILAEKSNGRRKNQVVPYRSSCLTRILQNSLGGNSKTIMICAISPANDNYQESLSTLRYADQVKKIKNHATVNESLTDKLIRELREQNERLKNMIKGLQDKSMMSPTEENLLSDALDEQREVQKKISKNRQAMKSFAVTSDETGEENLLNNISDIDLDKLEDSDHEISALVYMDMFQNNEPYLTNLNEDQLLSGKLKYNIEAGKDLVDVELIVGRKNGNPTPNVVLGALGIEANHAKIYRREDRIYISTYSETAGDFTYVNGENVYESMEIFHNDRIVFGTGCVFVLKTPEGVPRKPISEMDLTYEFAVSELQNLDKNKSMFEDEQLMGKLKQIEKEIQDEKTKMQDKIRDEQKRFHEEIARVKAQKELQNKQLMQELKRKEEEAERLRKERAEFEQVKAASRRLQEELELEKQQKLELERCLQESMQIEHSLREARQKQIHAMEERQRERLQELRQHQEKLEVEERLKQQQEEVMEKIKQQQQYQRYKEQSERKAEEEMRRHEEILRLKMISCQNENILSERFLELKKKKKEVEELRSLLIKKERAELQKKLIELLPQIIELNLIAKEMQRQIEVTARIDYEYFGYYELTECLKNSSYKSRIKLRVLVENHEEGRVYFWTVETFKNRLYLAKDMLEKYIQDPTNPTLQDKDNDPFWDPKEFELIGQAYLTLEHLLFNLDYSNPSLKIIGDRATKGELAIRVYPTSPDGSENLSKEQQKSCEIHNPRAIFEKDLHYIVAIDRVKLDGDEIVEYYVEYDVLENNYKFVNYRTNNMDKPETNYFRKHLFKEVTEPTLLYINGSQMCFKVYGLKKSHKLASNGKVEYEPTQADIDQINSFISQTKNEAVVKTPKNPKNEIYENPDVLGQIDRAYDNQQKEIRRREAEDDAKSVRSSRTKNSDQSTPSSSGGKNSKDGKDKDKCSVF